MKQLNENHANRYSFVCNALLNIGNCQSIERLNEVGLFITIFYGYFDDRLILETFYFDVCNLR